jgi:hypothetical protein
MNYQNIGILLQFSGDLSEDQLEKVVQNVLDGLVHTVNTAGLIPDDAEHYTKKITVKDIRTDVECKYKFVFDNK